MTEQTLIPPEILTRDEAAVFLRLSTKSLDYLAKSGQVPHRKAGRRVIFSRKALERWASGENR
jgi:excisionase family DNA binding protein